MYRKLQKNNFVEYDESVISMQFNDEDKLISDLDFFILIKNYVPLLNVLDKDIRFIEKACKTATQEELDKALTKIAPNNFKGIKILLDAGAKVHKEWIDEDGYRHDDIDNIETEILKKKINDILGGK